MQVNARLRDNSGSRTRLQTADAVAYVYKWRQGKYLYSDG